MEKGKYKLNLEIFRMEANEEIFLTVYFFSVLIQKKTSF